MKYKLLKIAHTKRTYRIGTMFLLIYDHWNYMIRTGNWIKVFFLNYFHVYSGFEDFFSLFWCPPIPTTTYIFIIHAQIHELLCSLHHFLTRWKIAKFSLHLYAYTHAHTKLFRILSSSRLYNFLSVRPRGLYCFCAVVALLRLFTSFASHIYTWNLLNFTKWLWVSDIHSLYIGLHTNTNKATTHPTTNHIQRMYFPAIQPMRAVFLLFYLKCLNEKNIIFHLPSTHFKSE